MAALIDITGYVYGRLTAVARTEPIKGDTAWRCACSCGREIRVRTTSLRCGNTASCGCLRTEETKARFTKHGQKAMSEYGIWSLMRDRCNNINNTKYSYYGGRGISVCERWNDFALFLADMGERPTAVHTLDRKDSEKNYSPENCQWATRKEQTRNRGITKRVERGGECKPLAEWVEISGFPYMVVYKRLRRGWSVDDALTKPLRITK